VSGVGLLGCHPRAQEIVELALKGMLGQMGIEPPHWHDVGGLIKEYAARFPELSPDAIDRVATISAWLRKEREFSRADSCV
jgi:HEPN domain-containing protein